MTQSFKQLLFLFGAASRGIEAKTDGELNISEIRRLALEQGIWTVIFPTLAKLYPEAEAYRMEFLHTVSQSVRQREFSLRTIEELNKNGISCMLLKGSVVASMYAEPELRTSGDTDILINSSDEKKAEKILEALGYKFEKRKKTDHHLKAYHPTGGLLEVHVELYSYHTRKILFNGLDMYKESPRKIKIGDTEVGTLGYNDTLVYLTAHYIKHLVNSGGGVRQMMDLLLYLEKYQNDIDFEVYNKLLTELKYDKLLDVIKTVGALYFGFDYPVSHKELAEQILTDSEEGGVFGYSTDKRIGFYYAYCEKRTEMSKLRYRIVKWFKAERTILNSIFLSQKDLIKLGYSYANHKILIPIGWIHHIFDVVFKKKQKPVSQNEAFSKRMEMMKKLGMIK